MSLGTSSTPPRSQLRAHARLGWLTCYLSGVTHHERDHH